MRNLPTPPRRNGTSEFYNRLQGSNHKTHKQMKHIKLTRNQQTIVDNDMFDKLNQFKWFALWQPNIKGFYAARNIRIKKTQKIIRMHRLIMKTPKNMMTDHINGNTLDNRKSNLRICTNSENQQNRQQHRNDKLVGITIRKHKYKTSYEVERNNIYLGIFSTPKLARQAYLNNIKPINKQTCTSNSTK